MLSHRVPPRDLRTDRGLIGRMDRRDPRRASRVVQRRVRGNVRAVADRRHRIHRRRVPVAVDDEARIDLAHEHRVQRRRQQLAEPGDADVPGDMPHAVGRRQPHVAQRHGQSIAGMIADQEER